MTPEPGNSSAGPAVLQVLLVDDNPPDLLLLKLAISREYPHCNFHTAGTGEDAFRFLLREGRYSGAAVPDLIVLDLNLPLKNGEEVLALIRGSAELRDIPVVLCSSSPRELHSPSSDHPSSGDEPPVHPDACLTKPCSLDAYLALGREIMACYRRRRTAGA